MKFFLKFLFFSFTLQPTIQLDEKLPGSCEEALLPSTTTSGEFLIKLAQSPLPPFVVHCVRMGNETCTLIALNTRDNSESFQHNWKDYKRGFGKPNRRTNYFVGLQRLHEITSNGAKKLYVALESVRRCLPLTEFDDFRVADESQDYALSLGRTLRSGPADALRFHNHLKFSTADRDNDGLRATSCAAKYKSGWWFGGRHCMECNLFGPAEGRAAHGIYCKHQQPLKIRKVEMFLVASRKQ